MTKAFSLWFSKCIFNKYISAKCVFPKCMYAKCTKLCYVVWSLLCSNAQSNQNNLCHILLVFRRRTVLNQSQREMLFRSGSVQWEWECSGVGVQEWEFRSGDRNCSRLPQLLLAKIQLEKCHICICICVFICHSDISEQKTIWWLSYSWPSICVGVLSLNWSFGAQIWRFIINLVVFESPL